jgi:hypothetical protein
LPLKPYNLPKTDKLKIEVNAMTLINKIPRGLRVLAVMAILAVLVWRFAVGTVYYYFWIGGALLLTAAKILVVYWHSARTPAKSPKNKTSAKQSEDAETPGKANDSTTEAQSEGIIPIEKDYTDTPAIQRAAFTARFNREKAKTNATDAAARYIQMAGGKSATAPSPDVASSTLPLESGATRSDEPVEPPMPLIEDESTLTIEEKNELLNAVWYRCENPYCKYTHFLSVHYILEEKEGGTNKLDNLIVLCPYCHDLTHRGEVPETQLREWISNREERFKFKPDWHYFK